MSSPRFEFVIVAIALVAAAGGGSYLATRHNASQAASAPAESASAAPATEVVVRSTAPVATFAARAGQPSTITNRPVEKPRVERPAGPAITAPPTAPVIVDRGGPPASDGPTPAAPVSSVVPATEEVPAPAIEARVIDAQRTAEPSARTFEELVVSADAVVGLQTEGLISSDRARVEDRIEARVSRDVRVGNTVAIPAGALVFGNVVVVERGGRARERARLGIRFHTLKLADGSRLAISTETIYRYGDSPGNGSAAKIGGGAVAGAILGAIIGGGKGAAIGAASGAGAGTAAVMSSERSVAVFPPGSEVTARVLSPITVSVEHP